MSKTYVAVVLVIGLGIGAFASHAYFGDLALQRDKAIDAADRARSQADEAQRSFASVSKELELCDWKSEIQARTITLKSELIEALRARAAKR